MTLSDDDYTLEDGRAWINAGPYAVRIVLDDAGKLSIGVWPIGDEMSEPLGAMTCLEPTTV